MFVKKAAAFERGFWQALDSVCDSSVCMHYLAIIMCIFFRHVVADSDLRRAGDSQHLRIRKFEHGGGHTFVRDGKRSRSF